MSGMFLVRKVDVAGTLLPIAIAESAVPLPLFDPMQVESIGSTDNWAGLSPVAPIQARFVLRKEESEFKGEAHFSVGMGNCALG